MRINTAQVSALARVKPCPQASALRLCSPSLRFVLSASLQGWAIPLGWTLATPDLAGQADGMRRLPFLNYDLLDR
jgi:hypothetical protein